jgi:DNA-binding Lrp family transcriptional regulator
MSRQKQPETSKAAFLALHPDKLLKDYKLIKIALQKLGEANYEKIASYLNITDLNVISRRTKEMEKLGIIYKPGTKSKTSRNREAYNYRLVLNGEVSFTPEKIDKTQKSAGEYAKAILATQPELFPKK